MNYYLVWGSYDGVEMEVFTDSEGGCSHSGLGKRKLEERLAEISAQKAKDGSVDVIAVIRGKEIKWEAVEVATKIRVDD